MFSSIAYNQILGIPMVAWGGIFTFLCLLATGFVGFLHKKGNFVIPYKAHPLLAMITTVFAFFHGLLAILASLGY